MKRLLVALLSGTLCLSMFPNIALAQEETGDVQAGSAFQNLKSSFSGAFLSSTNEWDGGSSSYSSGGENWYTNSFKAYTYDEYGDETRKVNYRVEPGDSITFDVYTDLTAATYTWYDPDGNIIGEAMDQSSYTLVPENGQYECWVGDGNGNYAAPITFDVNVENEFYAWATDSEDYDTNYTCYAEKNAQLSLNVTAEATDDSMLTYSWYTLNDEGWELIDGETDSTLIVKVDVAKNYYCHVEDGYGNSEDVWFYVHIDNGLRAWVTDDEWQGNSYTYKGEKDDQVTLSVSATATDDSMLAYTWHDASTGEEIEGETTSTLDVTVEGAKTYYCLVEDGYGNYEYVWFYIGLENGFHAWATGGEENEGCFIYGEKGEQVTLSVTVEATDDSMLTYKWYDGNWEEIEGETEDALDVTIEGAQTYICEIDDGYGNSDSIWFYVRIENGFSARAADSTSEYNGYTYYDVGVISHRF